MGRPRSRRYWQDVPRHRLDPYVSVSIFPLCNEHEHEQAPASAVSSPSLTSMTVEMIFGVATALNFCRDGNLGQCAAHYIMGSAFIGYAAILVIMLNVGGKWLERTGCSQEMLDSSVITVWVGSNAGSPSWFRASLTRDRASSTRLRNIMAGRGRTRICNIP
jgi:hypothetical protein